MYKNIEHRPTIQVADNDPWAMISPALLGIAAIALGYFVATGFDNTRHAGSIADGTSITTAETAQQHR